MNRYDNYKDSSVQWIGKIPSHWEVKRMRFILSYQKGKNPNSLSFDCEDGMFPYLSMDYLRNSSDIIQYALPNENYTECDDGDILLLWDGSNAGEFIKSKSGILCSTCAKLSPIGVNSQFFWYYCKSSQSHLQDLTNGMGIPHVDADELRNMVFCVPTMEEQMAIAEYLDKKCDSIDKVIAAQEKRVEYLTELKNRIITDAVTKGINPDVTMRQSCIDWIGEIPSHWKKCRFKNFIKLITEPSQSDFKIGLENIESNTGNFISTSSEFEGNGVAFTNNDILYGKLRPYLCKVWLAEFPGNAVGDFFVFRCRENASPKFVKYLMLSDGFTKVADGSTFGAKMPRVASNFILTLHYFLPSLEEQKKIEEYIETKIYPIDNALIKAKREIELLKEFKQSIITDAVTGKIKVYNL
jgi:restriction endonuclease S subunit